MPAPINRERTNTSGSLNESGHLRDRTNTNGSFTGNDDCTTLPLMPPAPSPTRRKSSGGLQQVEEQQPQKPSSGWSKSMVDWIHRLRLPRSGVPLVTGLDRVVFSTQSAAEAVRIAGIQPPRYLCYMLSGGCCDVIQFAMDYILSRHLGVTNASTCWFTTFTASIIFRHSFHRYLVFGDYVGGYWNSLLRMYGGYSVIIVLSTIFHVVVTKWLHLSHTTAWIGTLLWTGIVNYFILKKLWSFGGAGSGSVNK